MSYGREIYAKAEREMTQRRLRAEGDLESRRRQIFKAIPEAEEIDLQLSGVGAELARIILTGGNSVGEKIEAVKNRNLQGQAMLRGLLARSGFPEDALEVHYICNLCQDSGIVEGERCQCFKRLMSKYAVDQLNASSQMKLSSFDSFSLDMYPAELGGEVCRGRMERILAYCRGYAESFTVKSPSIFMQGLTGLGKTHLSLAIAGRVTENGYSVAYDSIVNYLIEIEKEHFGKSSGERNTLGLLLGAELLILDDFGSEYDSSFYQSTIYNIINTRLNKGVPTIISSNLNFQELENRYDSRVVSRIIGTYDTLRFTGEDIRQIKRRMGR